MLIVRFKEREQLVDFILAASEKGWPARYENSLIKIDANKLNKECVDRLISSNTEIKIVSNKKQPQEVEENEKPDESPKRGENIQPVVQEREKVDKKENFSNKDMRSERENLKKIRSLKELEMFNHVINNDTQNNVKAIRILTEVGFGITDAEKIITLLIQSDKKVNWNEIVENALKLNWKLTSSIHRDFSCKVTKYFTEIGINLTLNPFLRMLKKDLKLYNQMQISDVKSKIPTIEKDQEKESGKPSDNTEEKRKYEGIPPGVEVIRTIPDISRILNSSKTVYKKINDIWEIIDESQLRKKEEISATLIAISLEKISIEKVSNKMKKAYGKQYVDFIYNMKKILKKYLEGIGKEMKLETFWEALKYELNYDGDAVKEVKLIIIEDIFKKQKIELPEMLKREICRLSLIEGDGKSKVVQLMKFMGVEQDQNKEKIKNFAIEALKLSTPKAELVCVNMGIYCDARYEVWCDDFVKRYYESEGMQGKKIGFFKFIGLISKLF